MRSRTHQSSSAVRRAAANDGTVSVGAVATCVLAGCSMGATSERGPAATTSGARSAAPSSSANDPLTLPFDVPLHSSQHREPNAFRDSGNESPTICYEDAAVNLQIFSQAGDPDPTASMRGVEEAAYFFDAHSLNQTRTYNLLCWAHGADPTGQADFVDSGRLPQDRADSCDNEWNKLDRAWSTLLDPHRKR